MGQATSPFYSLMSKSTRSRCRPQQALCSSVPPLVALLLAAGHVSSPGILSRRSLRCRARAFQLWRVAPAFPRSSSLRFSQTAPPHLCGSPFSQRRHVSPPPLQSTIKYCFWPCVAGMFVFTTLVQWYAQLSALPVSYQNECSTD